MSDNYIMYLLQCVALLTHCIALLLNLQVASGSLTVIGLFGSASEVGTLTGTLLLL